VNDLAAKQAIVSALAGFVGKPLAEAATLFFESLGYKSEKRIILKPNSAETFVATFAKDKALSPDHALLADWQSVDFLFQLTDDEIRAAAIGNQQFLFDSKGKWSGAAMESYLFFAITLKQPHYSRTELSAITRAVNRLFPMPAMLLFRHGDTLTLAVINRRLHKLDSSKDVLEKMTLIKDIRLVEPHRAHIEILSDLSFDSLRERHDFSNFVTLHAAWQKTLDSSELNKRFFLEVANWYFWALNHTEFPKDAPKQDGKDHISVIRLITRLMFCWFIKEKGLVPDILFDERKLPQILNGFVPDKANAKESVFYKAILQNLFFATLNTEMDKRGWAKEEQNFMAHSLYRFRELFQKPNEALDLFRNIPFLNGGLFECLDKDLGENAKPRYVRIDGFSRREDSQPIVPDFIFFGPEREVDLSADYGDNKFKKVKVRGLIHTLNHYKFTIAENTPIEEEIALDPELSGKVFENLLAAYNPETGATARKQTGSFYTPREIVNYMVDEALIACLNAKLEAARPSAKDAESRLRHLFAYNNERHSFTAPEVDALIAAIDGLKSLDPAVGSGAFPMGILHKIVFILGKLDPRNEKWKQRQIVRVRDAIAAAEKIEDADVRERAVRELDQQITGINEAFEDNELDYGRKLYLIENCIYGVDIQPIAVQIAKMRFFISLIVDQKVKSETPNRGVRPLPNLETRFVAANSLIEVNRPGQQLLRNHEIDTKEAELRRVRERHFLARTPKQKAKCRDDDIKLRTEIAELLKDDGWDTATARRLASWDPYDQNASADFFDAEWMFGISEGFDICEGNPPYVGKQALQQQQPAFAKYAKNHFQAAKGRDFDLFALFIERSIALVQVGGIVSFIVPTGWYTGPGFSLLRRHILLQSDPLAFVNLPYDMFEEAWVDTTVFHTRRRKPILVWPRKESCRASLKTFGKRDRIVAQGDFYQGSTVIDIVEWLQDGGDEFLTRSDPHILAVLAKIRKSSVPLSQCSDVQRGVTPFVLTERPFHANSRRAFDGTIRRYTVEAGPIKYIRFDDSLAEFKPSRYFTGKRILLRELISRQMRLQACIVDEDFVTNKSMQSLLPLPDGPHLNLLLGIINSRLLSWYFLQRSNVGHRDDFPKIVLKETRELPIPLFSAQKQTAGKEIIDLVEHILKAKRKNLVGDTAALEHEIDEQVYALFALTQEEIKIVETV
jgi:adenine-specific DNA-methyltransferase